MCDGLAETMTYFYDSERLRIDSSVRKSSSSNPTFVGGHPLHKMTAWERGAADRTHAWSVPGLATDDNCDDGDHRRVHALATALLLMQQASHPHSTLLDARRFLGALLVRRHFFRPVCSPFATGLLRLSFGVAQVCTTRTEFLDSIPAVKFCVAALA